MDWNFLVLLMGTLLMVSVSMTLGYWVGVHNTYVKLVIADMKDRNEYNRQQLERMKNSDRDSPDRNVG